MTPTAVALLRLFSAAKLLSKDEDLQRVVAREHTGSGDSAQHVGAGALEHGEEALVLEDLGSAVQRVPAAAGESECDRGERCKARDGLSQRVARGAGARHRQR